MESDSLNSFSRRNFLKISAGIASLAVLNSSSYAYSKDVKQKKLSISQIPDDCVEIAKQSVLVQDSWKYLLNEINNLHSEKLRTQVLGLYKNTCPTFMSDYSNEVSVNSVYKKLKSAGYIDSSKVSVDNLFPPLRDTVSLPQPFYSAPGSGYSSHHCYPGGLVTHTAVNVYITKSILNAYKEIMNYDGLYDAAVAGQLLHDLAKPWVFQWKKDGSSLNEISIAGTGAHHVFSIAESIYRNLPKEVIVAQACAHTHPGDKENESQVVNWIKAASILAGVSPISFGLLSGDGKTLPRPMKQAGFIVHLGDHDFVLSGPAAQQSVAVLKDVAKKEYGFTDNDLSSAKFNKFRNYIASNYSFMRMHEEMSLSSPYYAASAIANLFIEK